MLCGPARDQPYLEFIWPAVVLQEHQACTLEGILLRSVYLHLLKLCRKNCGLFFRTQFTKAVCSLTFALARLFCCNIYPNHVNLESRPNITGFQPLCIECVYTYITVLYDADDNSMCDVLYQMPGRLAVAVRPQQLQVISKLLP